MSNDKSYNTLKAALTAVDATLHLIPDDENAAQTILQIVKSTDAKRVAYTTEPLLADIKLVEALKESELELVDPATDDFTPEKVEEWKMTLAATDTGISSAVGIAEETGSMLMPPMNPDQRSVSLLPVHHVAVLRAEQVVPDISGLMRLWQEKGNTAGNAVFVTGPSRTADIEKELVLGIHGPQTVDVILLV
ncbi:lactate utilization protein C [bacterium BMS3Bbin04]|nr:lactate utilization protein C [bacterium BMS3Bbin04]